MNLTPRRMNLRCVALLLMLSFVARAAERPAASDPAAEIAALLTAQSAAWNRGDIDGFMSAYLQSDDLRFASGSKVTYGWQATRDGYKKRYPDKATMGELTFTDLAITPLGPDAAIAFGRWKLTRERDTPNGLFTLTLKKTSAGWRIIQDHTS